MHSARRLGVETVATVLQCSGNGRGFFPNKPSGTPWTVGAAGCVLQSGVPLKTVAQALGGVAEGMRHVTGIGGEKLPAGIDPRTIVVERSPPGSKADPSQPSVLEMGVKFWINAPIDDVPAGMVQIHGVAFGGLHAVRRVEVSIDGGRSWREARFIGPDLGRFAWRQFVLEARLTPGRYTLASRATDMAGNVRPEARFENVSGYNNTGLADHAVQVTVA